MNKNVSTVIDPDLCNGCGICVSICPSQVIKLSEGKAVIDGTQSLNCGHCESVCPQKAIKVTSLDQDAFNFNTFKTKNGPVPFGDYNIESLVQLMRSRRSCRLYTDQEVSEEVLDDLIKIGITAPTGTNSQCWMFTTITNRKDMLLLGDKVCGFFKKVNNMAINPLIRLPLKLLGKDQLDNYYKEHYETVKEGIEDWEKYGRDRLFHGATAAIIVSSKPGASCPSEDALLATQNILLAAHAMGLGTCLIGFAIEAFKGDKNIQKFMQIPSDEKIYSFIAIGHPKVKYLKMAGRKKVVPRKFTE